MDSVLMLEDGRFFRGVRFGGGSPAGGEVVFHTGLTGYQEILTDPSYEGQVVTLTYPHIGNYGVNAGDVESRRVHARGLVVRDHHPVPSNWRSSASLGDWLAEADVWGLCGVDTRALVLHLRHHGALRGVLRPLPDADALPIAGQLWPDGADPGPAAPPAAAAFLDRVSSLRQLQREASELPSMAGLDLASLVTCPAPYAMGDPASPLHVVVIDFGAKQNILRQLIALGCRLTVVPAATPAGEVLQLRPDGVLLSNGPGDPGAVGAAVTTIADLLGRVPIFGICLGHQLLARALGGRTYKLKFGHRGANHPVRNLDSGRVEITSQNHGFAVDAASLDGTSVQLTYLHLNDDTVAGLRHRLWPASSVQFHPEASPGPHDSHHLFVEFVDTMQRHRAGHGGR